MGQNRINTVAKIFAAQPHEREALLKAFVQQRREHLLSKHDALDCFERYENAEQQISDQIDIAETFAREDLCEIINNQEAGAIAQSSHDHLEVLQCATRLSTQTDTFERIANFQILVDYLTRPDLEPVNRKAIHSILKSLDEERENKFLWRLNFRLPLAVAICQRFEGLPSEHHHREQAHKFIDTYFSEALGSIAAELRHELRFYNWHECSELLMEYRKTRLNQAPCTPERF